MLLHEACVSCIVEQSLKVAKAINADADLTHKLHSRVEELSREFSFLHTPPQVAAYVYKEMALIAGMSDLYAKQKRDATLKALGYIDKLSHRIATSDEKLLTAIKVAVAGNVIDLAAKVEFSLEDELESIFCTPFAIDHFEHFRSALEESKSVLLLGDNAGEHIFDKLFLQTIRELYPTKKLYFMSRGAPIINDITYDEAISSGLGEVAKVVDSGVDTPGFDYQRATKEARDLFDSVDLVISKGMGNYESLSPTHRGEVCFLLKVKCEVVARSLGQSVGEIICKMC